MSAPATNSGGAPSAGRTSRSRSRSRLLTAGQRVGRTVEPDDALPVESVGQPAHRPQEQTAARPVPPRPTCTILIRPGGGGSRAGSATSAPGRSSSRAPGRSARASSPVASLLAVRTSIRPKNISTSIRATWVDSTRSAGSWKLATFRECEWRRRRSRRSGAKGSWTWTMSRDAAAEQLLERAADVDGDRSRPAPGAARKGNPLADSEHPGVLAREQRDRVLLRGSNRSTRVADRRPRVRRRRDQDPMPSLGEVLGGARDELLDLVPRPPGMRTHLGDRKRVSSHSARLLRAARAVGRGSLRAAFRLASRRLPAFAFCFGLARRRAGARARR